MSKREFVCEKDANIEIAKHKYKTLKKLKFHDVTYSILMEERRRRGRPSKTKVEALPEGYKYFIDITYAANDQKIISAVDQASFFVQMILPSLKSNA